MKLKSEYFPEEFDVLREYKKNNEIYEEILFADDIWDFSTIPGRPDFIRPHTLVIDWKKIKSKKWRLATKELMAAQLNPTFEEVAFVPKRKIRPLPLSEIGRRFNLFRRWSGWAYEHGAPTPEKVTQAMCDRYLNWEKETKATNSLPGLTIRPVREYSIYRRVLTVTYPEKMHPWGKKQDAKIVGARYPKNQNLTPWIPEEVFNPLLAGALFVVETASVDILKALNTRLEFDDLKTPTRIFIDVSPEAANKKARTITYDYFEDKPIPVHILGDKPYKTSDCLADNIDFSLMFNQVGFESTWEMRNNKETRKKITEFAKKNGTYPSSLIRDFEITEINGEFIPWTDRIYQRDLQENVRRLITASWIVVAALSGMRPAEVQQLRKGCLERLDAGDTPNARWRLHSKVFKNRKHGGDSDHWLVIDPVAQAIGCLEQLTIQEEGLLFSARNTAITKKTRIAERNKAGSQTTHERLDFSNLIKRFILWQNKEDGGQKASLPAVPQINDTDYRVRPSQFRRTLARQLAFHPHGTIASKVQLKHISANITEGYWGPAGESAEHFLNALETEEKEARLDKLKQRFLEYEEGKPLTGGGSKKLQEDFAFIHKELDNFQGTVEKREKRIVQLLERKQGVLHIGFLNDCHFTDPSKARCLRNSKDKSKPLINACDPSRCGNAVIGGEHVDKWKQPLLQIDNLLVSKKVPKNEKTRLREEKTRIEKITKEFK